MKDFFEKVISTAIEILPIVLISMFGGMVRILKSKKVRLSRLISESIIAAFVGIILYYLLLDKMPITMLIALIGISGVQSREILQLLEKIPSILMKNRFKESDDK